MMCPPVDEVLVLAATHNLRPGQILEIQNQAETRSYTRTAHDSFNYLTSFAAAQPPGLGASSGDVGTWVGSGSWEKTFFCNGINGQHVLYSSSPERIIYQHNTYVRGVAGDSRQQLYFSEATGAKDDGVIYKLNYDSEPHTAEEFYRVRRGEIGGFWAGDFAFGPEDALYVSNGNRVGAAIWQCPMKEHPYEIFRTQGIIAGFCFVDPDTILYTDGTNRISLLHVGTAQVETFYTSQREDLRFSDVGWTRISL